MTDERDRLTCAAESDAGAKSAGFGEMSGRPKCGERLLPSLVRSKRSECSGRGRLSRYG